MSCDVRRFARSARSVLTVTLIVNAALLWLAILAQAAFAGSFLSGTSDALAWHERNAAAIGFGALGQLVLATLATVAGHARWLVVASTVIFLAIGNQISLGYDRDLAVHVPLGVAIFGAQTATTLLLVARARRTATIAGGADTRTPHRRGLRPA